MLHLYPPYKGYLTDPVSIEHENARVFAANAPIYLCTSVAVLLTPVEGAGRNVNAEQRMLEYRRRQFTGSSIQYIFHDDGNLDGEGEFVADKDIVRVFTLQSIVLKLIMGFMCSESQTSQDSASEKANSAAGYRAGTR